MTLQEVREFLEAHIRQEAASMFGLTPGAWLERVTDNWFNDAANYDGRWALIEQRGAAGGRILDMAAGCGTFVLYGLHAGRDVVGIEPEGWKREYFHRKSAAAGYPDAWRERLVEGVGEELPFPDASFDLVTTYQTLEHVRDVRQCLSEMLRVLKPGGVLYARAPDYNSFFEPHYRLPFLPRMNRRVAAAYLKALGRPVEGLNTLNWVTGRGVRRAIQKLDPRALIEDNRRWYRRDRKDRIRQKLPAPLRSGAAVAMADALCGVRNGLIGLAKTGREEKTMDLWVTRGN